MKTLGPMLLVPFLAVGSAMAQTDGEGVDEGLSLLEQGARIIMRSMLDEMEPALRDLQGDLDDAAAAMGPLLRDLVGKIGDLSQYYPPEKLPNGDIILRRKPVEKQAPALPDGETEI